MMRRKLSMLAGLVCLCTSCLMPPDRLEIQMGHGDGDVSGVSPGGDLDQDWVALTLCFPITYGNGGASSAAVPPKSYAKK